jgi:hypothetical protein
LSAPQYPLLSDTRDTRQRMRTGEGNAAGDGRDALRLGAAAHLWGERTRDAVVSWSGPPVLSGRT